MNKRLRMWLGIALSLVGIVIFWVIRSQQPRLDTVTPAGTAVQGRMKSVAWVYEFFHQARGRSPESLEELVQFGREIPGPVGPVVLTEEVLRLPRDQQLVVIRYRLALPASPPRDVRDGAGPLLSGTNGVVLAHEQTGINNKRFVVYAGSHLVEEVDEATFLQLTKP